MGATWNPDVEVNVYNESQSVDVESFDRIVFATEDVEAGFTETHRIYESNNDLQEDTDVSAAAQAAGEQFFAQTNRPATLVIASVTYASLETDLDTLLAAFSDFYGVTCYDRTKATQNALADWVVANDKLGAIQSSDSDILAGTALNLFETLDGDLNPRAFGIWHDTDTEMVDLAWLAGILSANPDVQSGVAHTRTLQGMTEQDITGAEKTQLLAYNGNAYLDFYGTPVMRPGLTFNAAPIEDQVIEDWFEARLQEAIAAMLIRTSNANTKVEYTNTGLAMIEAEIRGVVNRGVLAGHFVDGSEIIATPDVADVPDAEKLLRRATIPVTVTKTGSVKDIIINVGVTF